MQTGEYRGFVGQFPVWLHGRLRIWRVPVLLSLALHALLFWPDALQESGLVRSAGPVALPVRAHLQPPRTPALPQAAVRPQPVARDVPVTQAAPVPRNAVVSREETVPPAVSGSGMQLTPGLDAGAVRAYRIAWARALAGSSLRAHLGPERQGMLEVGVALAASGQVRDIAVLRGSGDRGLDEAVLLAMRSAMSAVPVPVVMQGREWVLTVPVEIGTVPPISAADR